MESTFTEALNSATKNLKKAASAVVGVAAMAQKGANTLGMFNFLEFVSSYSFSKKNSVLQEKKLSV
jgi:hypothetical protein